MDNKVYEVERMYMQNTSGNDYTIETMGRRGQTLKLNFPNVDGIEIDSLKPLEIKKSFIRMSAGEPGVLNLQFAYPTNLNIKFTGKIVIEVI